MDLHGLVALGSLLFLVAGTAPALEPGPDVILRLPFDGKLAAGSSAPRVYGEERYTDGVLGQAAVFGGQSRAIYPAPKDVPAQAGTIALWARPQDWSPTIDRFVFFATLLRPEKDRLARLMLYKVHDAPSLLLLAESGEPRDRQLLRCPVSSWTTGEWRHIVFTWDSRQIRVYVNGRSAGQAPGVAFGKSDWAQLVVGTSYPSWAFVGEEATAFDDLVLLDRALDHDSSSS